VASNGTAAWAVFGNPPPSSSDNNLKPYLDHGGCVPQGSYSPTPVPPLSTGDSLNANNGISTSGNGNSFDLLQCLVGQKTPCTKDNDCLGSNTCLAADLAGNRYCSYSPQGCTADADGNITGYGGNVFSLPIFDLGTGATCSGQMTSTYPIVGFATVRITSVTLGGPVIAQTIPHDDSQVLQDDGGCFGTKCNLTMAN
jgi:hypothetical protein